VKRILAIAAFALLMLGINPGPSNAAPNTAGQVRHTALAAKTLQTATRTVTVHAGDTYGRWASTYCGTFNAWPAIAAANGWPERRIPIGAHAVITCATQTTVVPALPTAAPRWVHPLASGKHGNSCYGWRASTSSFHGGVDMAQPWGTPIRAVTSGTVYRKAYEPGGAGHYVLLKHAGNVFTLYAHMPSPSPLATGAVVTAGQQIGRVGSTGNSTGPHLHFEVRTGGSSSSNRTNPATFMRTHGINIGC
jgi:murein DD-endopeptidase MepM/ murein hydrolase activator NlpD